MSLTITAGRATFVEAVTWLAKTLPARPASPVCNGILLEAEGGTLTLSVFDYEVSAKITIDVDVTSPGAVLVSGRLLAAIVRSMPLKAVELTELAGVLEVTCGPLSFTLPTMNTAQFPELPASSGDDVPVNTEVFKAAVAKVAVAASDDICFPGLTGIFLQPGPGELTLVASDRHRLAVTSIPIPADVVIPETLVPARALTNLTGGGDTISLRFPQPDSGGVFGVHTGRRETTTRTLDDHFPPYRHLIREKHASIATVDRDALTAAVKRATLVSNEKDTRITAVFDDETLTVTAGDANLLGSSVEKLNVDHTGPPVSVIVNGNFLLQGLATIDTPHVHLKFDENAKPIELTPTVDGAQYIHLLMPIRPT